MRENGRTESITSSFLHGVGFDLRTLLNGFAGPLQLMKFKIDDPDLAEVFRMFDSSLARLERLAVRSSILSDFEDNNPIDLDTEPINIVDIAKFSALEMQSLAELENISLNFPNKTPEISINGNHDLLLQVFQVFFEMVISLSTENTTIIIEFTEQETEVLCNITSPTATLPVELNIEDDSRLPEDSLSWDILLAKRILVLQNANIKVVENKGEYNKLEILFKR
ncbi:MAG: hypothetical protein ACLFNU_09140 [Bacteroidales bacterium]